MKKSFDVLLKEIQSCQVCKDQLPHSPNPVVSVSKESKILVIGQAPGTKVHNSGVPWDDASGRNLRKWLGVSDEQFYDKSIFGIVPMGFCYPGKGKSGDLPPRPECAQLWHEQIFDHLSNVQLTLLIGLYAQNYYLGRTKMKTLTETVGNYEAYLPKKFMPLVHPSPRNGIWMRKNPWFDKIVVPALQEEVQRII